MEPRGQKLFARVALLALTIAGLAWLGHLDYGEKISTNVIDLIPHDERSPEISVVRSIVTDRQARTMLFVLRAGNAPASAAATSAFASGLGKSHLFDEVSVLADPRNRDAFGRYIFEQRIPLLFPQWWAAHRRAFDAQRPGDAAFSPWLAEQAAKELDAFLARPESVAFQDLVPLDPLLLVPTLAEKARALGFGNEGANQNGLVWAMLKPSPFTDAGQEPVFHTIESALTQARAIEPAVQLEWTGVNRFAAQSKRRISGELSWLNTVSLLAVLGVACVFVRRLWKVAHLVPVVLFSILGAWVVATAAFSRLHILVFVVGSLLSGVAIDYGFYLYMQPALRPDESYREKLQRLLKPLLASCLTTVIGFSFLLLSELPLIRQLGVFVSAGLLSALLGAILYFAQLERPFLETRQLPRANPRRWRRATRALAAVAAIAAVIGLFRLTWRDDVRELEVPSPELRANDLRVRSRFGDTEGRSLYLTRGSDLAQARDALERFLLWHDAQFPTATGASLGWLLPTRAELDAAASAKLELFIDDFRLALGQHGYTPESFDVFFSALRAHAPRPLAPDAYDAMARDVLDHLSGPLGLLASAGNEARTTDDRGAWFVTIANHPATSLPPPEYDTFLVSQLESLNNLFTRYRSSALHLSAAGLGLVGLSVFVLYGLRRGIRIFCIPAGSCVLAFGLLGLTHHPLNLFHLLGAFLGVCLSHNYAIFSAENAGRHEAPPPSIRLSALCTAASFGVLAFSKIPVVSALGEIVTIIVLTALLMVELEPLAAPAPRE